MLMRTVPEELVVLAGACDTAALALEDGQLAALDRLSLSGTPAGNGPGGADLARAQHRALASANAALDTLSGVLESDMDDLYETAFEHSAADEQAAVGFASAGRGMP